MAPAVAIVPATTPAETVTLHNTVNLSSLVPPSIDPTGRLLISDSEIDEEPSVFTGTNLWELTLAGAISNVGLSPDAPRLEPTGVAYNAANGHVFLTNDDRSRVYELSPGGDGIYGTPDDGVSFFRTLVFGGGDIEDVAYDSTDGVLFLAERIGKEIFRVSPGGNGIFDGIPPTGDDSVSSIDLSILSIEDPAGLEYRASSDTLLLVDSGANHVWEITKDGFLLRLMDLNFLKVGGATFTPEDVALAPASDGSGAPRMYVVERGADNGVLDDIPPPQDGQLFELSAPFANLAPFVDAGPDLSVALSAGATLLGLVAHDGQPSPSSISSTWTKVSGPGNVNFGSPQAEITTATFSQTGTYELKLEASDTVLSNSDTVQVVVNPDPPANQAPAVNAGLDQAVTVGTVVSLSGVVTDDGLPNPPATTTVQWTKASGPGSVTFGNPNTASTTVSFGTIGTYQLRLAANDSAATTFDTVQVTVGALPIAVEQAQSCLDPETGGAKFADIAGLSAEALHAIDCLVFYGITQGTSPTTFSPNNTVTRWQMAIFLTREAKAAGMTLPDGSSQGFTDIGGFDAATQKAINQLAQLGITKGTAPGVYSPNDPVTRWQMAIFLIREAAAAGVTIPNGSQQGFTDIGGFDAATQLAINQLAQLGITKGTTSTTYAPVQPVLRWQMAIFLIRTLGVAGVT
jgi:hypothetical protein